MWQLRTHVRIYAAVVFGVPLLFIAGMLALVLR